MNTILGATRLELRAITRLHVVDTARTRHEAAKQGYTDEWWPKQYLSGKLQLERNYGRARLLLEAEGEDSEYRFVNIV